MELKRCSDCANGAWTGEERTPPEVCTICRFKSDGEPSEWKPKVFTNADRIRSMSDEELMQFLFNEVSNNMICSFCVPTMRTKCKCDGHCKNGILEWLKQPAED